MNHFTIIQMQKIDIHPSPVLSYSNTYSRQCLWDRDNSRITIHSSRRWKHNVLDTWFLHSFQKHHSTSNVVMIIVQWDLSRFTNCLKTGKMDNRIAWMTLEHFKQCLLIENICLVENEILASNGLDTTNSFIRGVGQIVNDNNLMASFEKLNDSVRAYVLDDELGAMLFACHVSHYRYNQHHQ